jgi:hypothetical protein
MRTFVLLAIGSFAVAAGGCSTADEPTGQSSAALSSDILGLRTNVSLRLSSGDATAFDRDNAIYCESDDCKGVVRGNSAYCDSSACKDYVRAGNTNPYR